MSSTSRHRRIRIGRIVDNQYGYLKAPTEINWWEKDRSPLSLGTLSKDLGSLLRAYRGNCQHILLRQTAQCFTIIWAMDESGDVKIAFEELTTEALAHGGTLATNAGYPRRRGATYHPVEEKKLGHPTLLGGGKARVAGELILDIVDDKLFWYVNCSSGRYCRTSPPSSAQKKAVHDLFIQLMDDEVLWDDVDD